MILHKNQTVLFIFRHSDPIDGNVFGKIDGFFLIRFLHNEILIIFQNTPVIGGITVTKFKYANKCYIIYYNFSFFLSFIIFLYFYKISHLIEFFYIFYFPIICCLKYTQYFMFICFRKLFNENSWNYSCSEHWMILVHSF